MKRFAALLACTFLLSALSGTSYASENRAGNSGVISMPAVNSQSPVKNLPENEPDTGKYTGENRQSMTVAHADGSIHSVMAVILISWIGISLYLFRIDRRIAKLEKKLHE